MYILFWNEQYPSYDLKESSSDREYITPRQDTCLQWLLQRGDDNVFSQVPIVPDLTTISVTEVNVRSSLTRKNSHNMSATIIWRFWDIFNRSLLRSEVAANIQERICQAIVHRPQLNVQHNHPLKTYHQTQRNGSLHVPLQLDPDVTHLALILRL